MKMIKLIKICSIGFALLFFTAGAQGQTIKQFNGQFNIFYIYATGGLNYDITGTFTDASGLFTASGVKIGDRIIDVVGNTFEIVTLSVNGSQIITSTRAFDTNLPSMGLGVIYSPTSSGFPLITVNTPAGVLTAALNTTTLSIDSKLPKYMSGTSLPVTANAVGDVIFNSSDSKVYKLTPSGWVEIPDGAIPIDYSNPVSTVPAGNIGDVIKSYWDALYYVFDGLSWVAPATISSLPVMFKMGDVFYVSGEKVLYMYDADSKWVSISGSSVPGGPATDLPTGSKPGDLFFNTDTNILYVFDTSGAWLEVSSNGSTPAGSVNPNPNVVSVKEGELFYNTSDHKLYVYNGTTWMTLDNTLPNGRVFVGNSSNVAVSVPLSGDATIINTGKLTINDAAITEAKLDKANIPLNGFANPTNDVSFGDGISNFKIINLANPSTGSDATTKSYVDALFGSPGSLLALPNNSLFIGNAANKATPVLKSLVPISGFDKALANVSMGTGVAGSNFKIVNMADPVAAQDAATKNYVDTRVINSSNISLPTGNLLVGSAINTASAVAKNTIPLSGFAAATADISLGGFKLNSLADPVMDQEAATKKYVDSKIIAPANISLTTGNLFVGDATGKAADVLKNSIPLSEFGSAAADISLGGFMLTNVAHPVSDTDGSTKKYVDDLFKSPGSLLSLPTGNFFVGSAAGTATAVSKNLIPISGFGKATNTLFLGDAATQFNISFLADPVFDQDAATKSYVDNKTSVPGSLSLPTDHVLVGDASNKATAVAKNAIPLSDFAAAAADISLGDGTANFKIVNLADPTGDQEAATKKYVDSKSSKTPVSASAPVTAIAGDLYYDTSTNRLNVYNGTDWIPADNQLATGELYIGNISGIAVATAKNKIPLSGFDKATADIALGDGTTNFKIVNLADPTADQEAATKKYVDSKTSVPGSLSLLTDHVLVGDASNKATAVAKNAIPLSDLGAATADISIGDGTTNFKIVNLADPTADQEAATKKYVDSKSSKTPVSATAPVTAVAGDMYFDTTTSRLNVYNGTNWIPTDNQLASGAFYVGNASGVAVATAKNTIPLSGFDKANADIALGDGTTNFKIINLADPVTDQEAATKKYVDSKSSKTPVGATAPVTAVAGDMYFDTTTSHLNVYNGTSWIPTDNQLATGELYIGNASGVAVATAKNTIPLSDLGAATADISIGDGATNFKIVNLADPTADQEAATKKYVDSRSSKTPAAATAPVTAVTGDLYYDTATNNLNVYNGTDWIPTDNKLAAGAFYVGNASGVAVATAKNTIPLSGFDKATTDIALGDGTTNFKIVNLADPTADQEAATKKYVDDGIANATSAGKDNLGDHAATKNIKLSVNSINNDGVNGKGLSFDTPGNASFGQDVTVNGNFYTPSDNRLKIHIETLVNVLQKIDQIRGVSFEYRDQHKYAAGQKIGVIAQELQKIYPEMVSQGEDGFLKVDYTQLTGMLLQAIKEQQHEMEALKTRMNRQQQQIDSILLKLN